MNMRLFVIVYDGCDNGCQGILWAVQSQCREVLSSNFSAESLKRLGAAIKESESDNYPLEYALMLSIDIDGTYSRDLNLGTIDYEGNIDPYGVIESGDDVYKGIGIA